MLKIIKNQHIFTQFQTKSEAFSLNLLTYRRTHISHVLPLDQSLLYPSELFP